MNAKDSLLDEFTFINYLSREEIKYHLPNEITLDNFWKEIAAFRKQRCDRFPFCDQQNNQFWYFLIPSLQKKLHEIDSLGKDSLYQLVKQEIESELIKDSLIEEALYSSVIEGAFSTIKRLKELVNKEDKPRDINDQMVLNNYNAMQYILEEKHKDISQELILKLHKIVTDKTLDEDDKDYTGRFRDDWVYIRDHRDRIIYTPPAADKVIPAIENLISWVNKKDEAMFIHPIIKASIVHFYMVYIHPFFDGNGRTARALFYFYLIKHRYEFFKYFSISVVVQKAKGQYYKAIRDVENNQADLTYFLIYMAKTILDSIKLVKERIVHHYHKDFVFDKVKEKGYILSKRQEKFLKRFLVSDRRAITIKTYQKLYNVVYETARRDLKDLHEKGILTKTKQRRAFVYMPNYDF